MPVNQDPTFDDAILAGAVSTDAEQHGSTDVVSLVTDPLLSDIESGSPVVPIEKQSFCRPSSDVSSREEKGGVTLVYGLWVTTKRVLLIFASGTIPCLLITNGMVHTGEIATMIFPILHIIMIGNILHLTDTGKNFLRVGADLRFAGVTLQFVIDVTETRDLRIAGATGMLILRLPIESLYRVTQDHMIKATGHQDRLDIVLRVTGGHQATGVHRRLYLR